MLIRDTCGRIKDTQTEFKENSYGVFYYKEGEDINEILETSPLLFESIECLCKEVGTDIKERLDIGPIVIRKIKIVDIC